MRPLRWLADRWRRWRRRKAAKKNQHTPLREFVYLDEVSVYSLVASRLGPIASEFTTKETASLSSQASSTYGVSAHGLTAQHGGQVQASQSTESQVVRKSIIQSTFKDLRDYEQDNLLLNAAVDADKLHRPRSVADLNALLGSRPHDGGFVDAQDFMRGRLFEIDVTLEAETIFRLNTIISSTVEIARESSRLAQYLDRGSVDEVEAMGKLLSQLLVGLVPLRGRAVDYAVVEALGSEWVVHQQLLADLPREDITSRDLVVVGVAEASLFWKDIRRVLFSNSRFRMMCRANADGLAAQWTPVKLVEVLHEAMPDLAAHLDDAIRRMEQLGVGMRPVTPAMIGLADPRATAFRTALVAYAAALASRYGGECSEESLTSAGLPTPEQCGASEGIDARRAAFEAVTKYVVGHNQIELDPGVAAELRAAALAEAGFTQGGGAFTLPGPAPMLTPAVCDVKYVDTEIIAIYW